MLKTNYHTHTIFCDGKDSVEATAAAAAEKGFDILGISGHAMYPFAGGWHIALSDYPAYAAAVRAAAEKYRDALPVLLGFEADYIPGITVPTMAAYAQFRPDYLIGSVHYIVTENGHFCADDTAENLRSGIARCFGGDARAAVCEYFSLQREMLKKGDFAIWGHADVIRKKNGVLRLFDEKESWYRAELRATADAAAKAGVIAEINTGAISRGAMDDVYPSAEFLAMMRARGIPVTISSDAHRGCDLDCAFDRATAAAKNAGYSETAYLNADAKICFQKIG